MASLPVFFFWTFLLHFFKVLTSMAGTLLLLLLGRERHEIKLINLQSIILHLEHKTFNNFVLLHDSQVISFNLIIWHPTTSSTCWCSLNRRRLLLQRSQFCLQYFNLSIKSLVTINDPLLSLPKSLSLTDLGHQLFVYFICLDCLDL